MQVVLVMFRADGQRRSFALPRQITVIGRREDCDLRIPLGDVSRKHCRLIQNGNELQLEDLGSSNGTYHNGQRIQETVIAPGDTIQIGPAIFVVQINGVPDDENLQPFNNQAASALSSSTLAGNQLHDAEPADAEAAAPSSPPAPPRVAPATKPRAAAAAEIISESSDDSNILTDPAEMLNGVEGGADDLVDFTVLDDAENHGSEDLHVPIALDIEDDQQDQT